MMKSAIELKKDKTYTFDQNFSDGIMCHKDVYKPLKVRDALAKVQEIGRPLTKSEISKYYY